jgi:hypothetical protein
MPFVSDSNLDENEQNPGTDAPSQMAGQVSGAPQAVSGQPQSSDPNSATDAPEAPTLAPATGFANVGGDTKAPGASNFDAKAPTSSGQWTNLQSYLDANNGGQFGEDFAAHIGKDVSQAQSSVTDAATNFQGQVDGATVETNPDVLGQVTASPETMTEEQQQAFQDQLNAEYGGPQSAYGDSAFQQAGAQAQAAYGESQAAKTASGQTSLLKKFYNKPTYTAGGQALDSAILSADPNAQAAIHSLSQEASNLPISYQNAALAANDAASAAAAKTAAAREAAQNTIGVSGGNLTPKLNANGTPVLDKYGNIVYTGAIGDVENAVNSMLGDNIANAPALYGSVQKALQERNLSKLTPDQLAALGEASKYSGSLYGVDPTAYLQQTSGNYSANTVITPQQQARLAALYKLAGMNNSFAPDGALAGTAGNPYAFDQSAFHNALSTGKNNFEASLKPYQDVMAHIADALSKPMSADQVTNIPLLQQQYADAANAYNSLGAANGPTYDFATGKTVAYKPIANTVPVLSADGSNPMPAGGGIWDGNTSPPVAGGPIVNGGPVVNGAPAAGIAAGGNYDRLASYLGRR